MAQARGYQGFGSFHSDNVQTLVALPSAEFEARCPPVPFAHSLGDYLPPGEEGGDGGAVQLGAAARGLFLLDADWTVVNHGAFGAVSRYAFEAAAKWRLHCERQPLRFLDRQLFPHHVRAIRKLAELMSCRPQDLVLLPNATAGLNVLLKSLVRTPSDVVYMPDIGYGSTKKIAEAACRAVGAQLVVGAVRLPVRDTAELFAAVMAAMPAGCTVAVFDWITSNSALTLPVKELLRECTRRGVDVVIDGAHAVGLLPVDLEELAAAGLQFFTGNCHKWLCGPRGTALMWVAGSRQADIHPACISHGSGCGFTSDFIWDGNRDYAAYLALPAALEFHQAIGLPAMVSHMQRVLHAAVELLVERWGTGTLAPLELCPPSMALVQLPSAGGIPPAGECDSADAKEVQDYLHHSAAIECPVKLFNRTLFCRLSVHVYNSLDDFRRLADAVDAFVASAALRPRAD
eukprot:jgi/Tetstr1/420834/TSEL_011909.t1